MLLLQCILETTVLGFIISGESLSIQSSGGVSDLFTLYHSAAILLLPFQVNDSFRWLSGLTLSDKRSTRGVSVIIFKSKLIKSLTCWLDGCILSPTAGRTLVFCLISLGLLSGPVGNQLDNALVSYALLNEGPSKLIDIKIIPKESDPNANQISSKNLWAFTYETWRCSSQTFLAVCRCASVSPTLWVRLFQIKVFGEDKTRFPVSNWPRPLVKRVARHGGR